MDPSEKNKRARLERTCISKRDFTPVPLMDGREDATAQVTPTLEATQGQILSETPQMPPDSGGICMGVD